MILGAGAVGGYFGARIHQAGGDVTFLVRPARANALSSNGLHIFSPLGNLHITPKIVTSPLNATVEKFDAVILTCKAYDLDTAIDVITPAVSANGLVIPLLNGIAHLDRLDAQYGRERVLGGFAHLGVTLDSGGTIKHLNNLHRMVIGSRIGHVSPQTGCLVELLASTGIDFSLSENIEWEMWDKFIFLSTLAAATCTMRSPIGDILQTHSGKNFILGLLDECIAIAKAFGHIPYPDNLNDYKSQLTALGSSSTSSMLRDIEQKRKTEADHILGDMVRRAELHGIDAPLLKISYSHVQAYEIRRNQNHVK